MSLSLLSDRVQPVGLKSNQPAGAKKVGEREHFEGWMHEITCAGLNIIMNIIILS